MTLIIDSKTPKEFLRRIWKAGKGTLPVVLDPRMTAKELESLIPASRLEKYSLPLFQLLATHPRASGRLFRLLIAESGGSPEVETSIIMSGRASERMLRTLRRSESKSVREHAELALVRAALESAGPDSFSRLLTKHSESDHGISLAVRQVLAEHPRTPAPILRKLAEDEADFIAALARRRLYRKAGRRRGTGAPRLR